MRALGDMHHSRLVSEDVQFHFRFKPMSESKRIKIEDIDHIAAPKVRRFPVLHPLTGISLLCPLDKEQQFFSRSASQTITA
jgi:hypothetical protein